MNKNIVQKNEVTLAGEICAPFVFSHITRSGTEMFQTYIAVRRDSGTNDIIPIIVNEYLLETEEQAEKLVGKFVCVTGKYRSRNKHTDSGKRKLILYVHADSIVISEEKEWKNEIILEGFLCKPPIYRLTPSGVEITDMMLALNRPYGKTDYLPCICWNKNARQAAQYSVGQLVSAAGRVQSREYIKRLPDDTMQKRTAYEISIYSLEEEECVSRQPVTS